MKNHKYINRKTIDSIKQGNTPPKDRLTSSPLLFIFLSRVFLVGSCPLADTNPYENIRKELIHTHTHKRTKVNKQQSISAKAPLNVYANNIRILYFYTRFLICFLLSCSFSEKFLVLTSPKGKITKRSAK